MIEQVSAEPDVSLVVTGHAERSLAHHTFKAVRRCLRAAADAGLRVEVVGVLDAADELTAEIFVENLGPQGRLRDLCASSLVVVSLRDAGLARNEGIGHTTAALVGLLDADNLPSRTWLVEAVRRAREHGGSCVVHPEQLLIFQGRIEVWQQYAGDDPRMRPENFYDRNYWDTFCLATRDVFEAHPYVATPRDSGFGPEDWHWNAETVHAGVEHISASGTALFYRVKSDGSVQANHAFSRSLIRPTQLLTDPARARDALDEARQGPAKLTGRRHPFLRRLLRDLKRPIQDRKAPVPLTGLDACVARLRRTFFEPDHYRWLYPSLSSLSDEDATQHFASVGRSEGRRGWLRSDELIAVAPARFDVAHYRALHGDVLRLSEARATRHYLDIGRHEGRRARLTRQELRALRRLDLHDYRWAHDDLAQHPDLELVQHYLEHGLPEGRRGRLTAEDRRAMMQVELGTWLTDEMVELHSLEPWIPLPPALDDLGIRAVGPTPDGGLTAGSRVWWQLVATFGQQRPDIVFMGPWLRMGGGDLLLARYANAVAKLRPDLCVAVVTTHDRTTHPELLDDDVLFVDLTELAGHEDLSGDERRHLVATLVTQYAPQMVHAFNSPEFFDAVELYPAALANSSRLFLSTFVIDSGPFGETASHLARRCPDYLSAVSGVIVDNHALVDRFHDLYRFDRDAFVVHHQPVVLPQRRAWSPRSARLQVAWAARFDRQKRLDILADVVEACAQAGMPIDWHVYGAPVIDSPTESKDALKRLRAAGVLLHGVYGSFADLPLDGLDLFMLTSESEGIPLTLLDIMAHRVPVMAPLVGGIPELIDGETGWPVARFDDIDAYVAGLRMIIADPVECERRADAAYDLLAREFTWDAFERRLAATPGYLH